ncbi:MAG: hydroxylamine reductase [Clostridium sp.]|nr:hydroxylamine reductase [Lacrimispora amygdalina]MBD9007351.1 hydroxylamine reductase [Clostridium sp.]
MDQKMFCYQCEQTAGCAGCTGSTGVCGKTAETARLQDQLVGAMIGLARAAEGVECPGDRVYRTVIEGLFTTLTNVSFDDDAIRAQIEKTHREKERLLAAPVKKSAGPREKAAGESGAAENAACAAASVQDTDDYNLGLLWDMDPDIRSLKSLILFGLKGMAAYAYHALMLGASDETVNQFFLTGLREIAKDGTVESLLPTVLKVGEVNLTCMAMLDAANTGTYGTPIPVSVPLVVERGPFIVVTGHDLKDLELLLKQTEGKGVNIYTHGEMLPAHAYPELRKYPQLKGNFGTAWQNQQKEFADIPAPILFTTNCLMPPKKSYADRVFTTEVVAYPGMVHIDDEKDFTPVIEKALELGGYQEDRQFTGINGGTQVMTGFGHGTILSMADQVIDAVKSGAIRHFFLVAGCDGAKPGRNYYTDFVKQTPADSIVLTLACGKFRFNDLDLGNIGGLPRIMDMGQCNDAYGAIKVAMALAEAFGCEVNELPLSFVLSWYEQKAVCILLTLLHLGIRNIRLGPSLPAFLSPNILNFLVENYGIGPVTTPEEDLKALLG